MNILVTINLSAVPAVSVPVVATVIGQETAQKLVKLFIGVVPPAAAV